MIGTAKAKYPSRESGPQGDGWEGKIRVSQSDVAGPGFRDALLQIRWLLSVTGRLMLLRLVAIFEHQAAFLTFVPRDPILLGRDDHVTRWGTDCFRHCPVCTRNPIDTTGTVKAAGRLSHA